MDQIEATLDSFVSVLRSPSSRVYFHLLLFEWPPSKPAFSLSKWNSQLETPIQLLSSSLLEELSKHTIEQVVFVAKSCAFSPDAFEFFAAASYLLWNDLSVYVVEAWTPLSAFHFSPSPCFAATVFLLLDKAMRADVPAGAVFLVATRLIKESGHLFTTLGAAEWVLHPQVRSGRYCLTPQVSRVRLLQSKRLPFGIQSMQNVRISNQFVPFLEMDFRFLYQVNYENEMMDTLRKARTLTDVADIIEGPEGSVFKVIYSQQQPLERMVQKLGMEPIAIGSSFPWVYRGVVHLVIEGVDLFLTCKNLFPCDDNLFSV